MKFWEAAAEGFKNFFTTGMKDNFGIYILQFILFAVVFYYVFKVLHTNKSDRFIAVTVFFALLGGVAFAFTNVNYIMVPIVVAMIALIMLTMFNTEIKRTILDSSVKKNKNEQKFTVTGVELIIDEMVRAIQNMSKKDVGALIVLSNNNLPEGIIESGTVINAQISSQMIEAVFYPKAPLHDGALIVEGDRLYAAGCFLPLAQNDVLPKELGSRHRAALGVTTVASVTTIVVSEETGIISIIKNGAIKKRYADAADIKNALYDYYWTDLTAEGKL